MVVLRLSDEVCTLQCATLLVITMLVEELISHLVSPLLCLALLVVSLLFELFSINDFFCLIFSIII